MLSLTELHVRAALLQALRNFFNQKQFLEVDTPVRLPHILPEANILPLSSENSYLQSSPESCMKRLLSNGCDKIFQICPCFRKEERGRHHLEEFTMLEWYRIDTDYTDLMQDCDNLLNFVAKEIFTRFPELLDTSRLKWLYQQEHQTIPPQKISVGEAFGRWSPVSLDNALAEERFDEVVVEYIEPQLGGGRISFLYDYPESMGSLARKKADNPDIAERFELYLEGLEIANGFSELTDPVEQRSRFAKEIEEMQDRVNEKVMMPEKFLKALETLPPSAGIALGVDRLFMLFLGKNDLSEAITFSPEDL